MNDLPEGWEWTTLSEVCDVILGQSPPGTSYNAEGVGTPFFQGKTEFGAIYPTVAKWTTEPRKLAAEGDVLVSVRAPVGPTNVAPLDSAVGRGLAALHPLGGIDSKFILWAMRASEHRLAELGTGTTFQAVSGANVRGHQIPLPPLPEQQRIVSVVEEHLSRLDSATESLVSAMRHLRAFDRSAMSLAQQTGDDRKLDDLLVDIEAGKSFKTPGRPASSDEWGVIKVSAMTWGTFREDENKAVPPDQRFDSRHEIRSGDLLLSRANTSEYVGAAVLVGDCRPRLLLSDKSMRLLPHESVDRRWLRFALGSPQLRSQMSALASGTSDSMRNISQAKVRSLRVRVPQRSEQEDISARIEAALDHRTRLYNEVQLAHLRADALRRSVLTAAFSGLLSSRHKGDQPASALLGRIRAARTEGTPTNRKQERTP